MSFDLRAAAIVSIIAESILYGLSLVLFGVTAWALFLKRTTQNVRATMCLATAALFVLSTMHMVVDAIRVYNGFVRSGSSTLYFGDITKNTFKNAVYEAETLVADAVLIYRCYIVWKDYRVIVGPILGYIGVMVAGTHTVWSISRPVENAQDIFLKQTAQWVLSFYAVAVATNLLATCLLAYKIWIVDRANAGTRTSTLKPIIVVTMECGAMYSIALVAMIITYNAKTNAAYVVIDIIGQIIPITFYIIIIRAALGRLKDAARARSTISASTLTMPSFARADYHSSGFDIHRMKPLDVRVDHYVEQRVV